MNIIIGKMPTQREGEYKGFTWQCKDGVTRWSLYEKDIPSPKKFSDRYIEKFGQPKEIKIEKKYVHPKKEKENTIKMDKMEWKKVSKSYKYKNANYKIDVHLHRGDDSHMAFLYLEGQRSSMTSRECSIDDLESAIESLEVTAKKLIDKNTEFYKSLEKKTKSDKASEKVEKLGFNW